MAPLGTEANQDPLLLLLVAATCLLAGLGIGWLLLRVLTGGTNRRASREAEQLLRTATTEADALRQKAELETERQARQHREALDAEAVRAREEQREEGQRLARREDALSGQLEQLATRSIRFDERETALSARDEGVKSREAELAALESTVTDRLSEIAGLGVDDARRQLLDEVRLRTEHEADVLRQRLIETARADARREGREITLQAIQRYAAETVAESTVRTVKIPSDDMKGRIIGREGRNIRALERATGADILVDDTPGLIAVSCFDPVRRAIAVEALQKLVVDGRVHPGRIEEVVATVKAEMEDRIEQVGTDAAMEANVLGLHPKVVQAMGRLRFRTSYGQNVLRHSIEVAYLCQVIADQLELDGELARRCGFLHDIGKSMDHEVEGGHPAIGMAFLRSHGETSEAVLNAVGGHHTDIPATTPCTPIVMAADAISGARPGARRESMEMYVKRLQELEGIARELPGVTEAHAIQAGREVRVILDAGSTDDAQAFSLSKTIAGRIEEIMTFPGEIKVTVLREVRAEAKAK